MQQNEKDGQDAIETVQQADSTSNNNSTSSDADVIPQPSPKPDQQDYVPTGTSSTSVDQFSQEKVEDPAHEEYVPLSASEMLAQSFADPTVPWSSNDGTEKEPEANKILGSKQEEPNIKYAYVCAPCVEADMWHTTNTPSWHTSTTPPRQVVFGSQPLTSPVNDCDNMALSGKQMPGDMYRWGRLQGDSKPNSGSAGSIKI